MYGALNEEELIRLRINLFSTIQWTERLAIAQMSLKQKQKSGIYSADQIKAGEKEVTHARHMAKGAAEEVLPALEALTKETVSS